MPKYGDKFIDSVTGCLMWFGSVKTVDEISALHTGYDQWCADGRYPELQREYATLDFSQPMYSLCYQIGTQIHFTYRNPSQVREYQGSDGHDPFWKERNGELFMAWYEQAPLPVQASSQYRLW